MSENEITDTVEFKFKMDKVERYISIAIFILFMLSFNQKYSGILTIILFALAAIVFFYYFKWYKKKPSYLILEDEQITIHPPLFFKPQLIKKHEIELIESSDKNIQVNYTSEGTKKSVMLYSILLAENDWKQITDELNKYTQK